LQYTLFLKEVGLPVQEALSFWKQEYSRPGCGEGCTHHWDRDGRRYTYNIRHLYGLEGSRVNYRSHCCQGILERRLQPGEEGGCPFRHFDTKHLQQLLNTEGVTADVQNQLVSMATDKKPREASKRFREVQSDVSNFQPNVTNQKCGELVDKKACLEYGGEKGHVSGVSRDKERLVHQEQGNTVKDAGIETCQECGRTSSCDPAGSTCTTQCTMCSVRIRKPLDFTKAFLRLLEGLKDKHTCDME
ncbi:hypothetical protein Bbelb_284310, partial [Branchiostoma belcheri]